MRVRPPVDDACFQTLSSCCQRRQGKAEDGSVNDHLRPEWLLIDPNPDKHAYFNAYVRGKYGCVVGGAGNAEGTCAAANDGGADYTPPNAECHPQETKNGHTISAISTPADLDRLLYPHAIPLELQPQQYNGEGFFQRFHKQYPAEVDRFVKAVDVLLPFSVSSGVMTKQYPLLPQLTPQQLRAVGAVGCRGNNSDASRGIASGTTSTPNAITQSVSLTRLEIAVINLLSCFGYTRQGYPPTTTTGSSGGKTTTSGVTEKPSSSPPSTTNDANHYDTNEYNLLKYFLRDEVASYHVYALSMMGYLSVVAEELVEGGVRGGGDARRALMEERVTYTRSCNVGEVKDYLSSSQHTETEGETAATSTPTATSATVVPPSSSSTSSCYGDMPLCPIRFADGSMFEDLSATIVVDYANENYGGPCTLTSTQEEILLMLKPDMLPGRQLCEVMGGGHEAIVVRGARLFCSVTGYGRTTRIAEVFPPLSTTTAADGNRVGGDVAVGQWDVAVIDAIVNMPHRGPTYDQHTPQNRLRCTHKAFLAFELLVREQRSKMGSVGAAKAGTGVANCASSRSPPPQPPIVIAGGRWGCGVFAGDLPLKVLQQWVAASAAGADRLDLYLFGDPIQPTIQQLVGSWEGMRVGDVCKVLLGDDASSCCVSFASKLGPVGTGGRGGGNAPPQQSCEVQ